MKQMLYEKYQGRWGAPSTGIQEINKCLHNQQARTPTASNYSEYNKAKLLSFGSSHSSWRRMRDKGVCYIAYPKVLSTMQER